MASTVIVSSETLRNLIEAHASLAAWYYQMSEALRSAGAGVEPPTDEQRSAFVTQLAGHFPELAAVAESVTTVRPYVPPPIVPAPAEVKENEGITTPAPPKDHLAAPAMVAGSEGAAEAAPASPDGADSPVSSEVPPPPPIVDPSKVKYE